GQRSFTPSTGVQIPLRTPNISRTWNFSESFLFVFPTLLLSKKLVSGARFAGKPIMRAVSKESLDRYH
ncbi:hypothetical protein, partial [uncultured Brachyspira sp.]|uniref:hypothetical protein n=1 Tax=uncultured Brachyspira sp. TaxID=221953 RepID=UPI002616BFF4